MQDAGASHARIMQSATPGATRGGRGDFADRTHLMWPCADAAIDRISADELLGVRVRTKVSKETLPRAASAPGLEPRLPRKRLAGRTDADQTRTGDESSMDHHVPKRRVPVTLWSSGLDAVAGQLFLDLDPVTRCHQTILEKLDESLPFLPAAVGPQGRIHLFNKRRILRVTPGKSVILADVFSRGFRPCREEAAELTLVDGTALAGKLWMLVERESQRISDFVNQASGFLVLLTPVGPHLIHPRGIAELRLEESAGAPLGEADLDSAAA